METLGEVSCPGAGLVRSSPSHTPSCWRSSTDQKPAPGPGGPKGAEAGFQTEGPVQTAVPADLKACTSSFPIQLSSPTTILPNALFLFPLGEQIFLILIRRSNLPPCSAAGSLSTRGSAEVLQGTSLSLSPARVPLVVAVAPGCAQQVTPAECQQLIPRCLAGLLPSNPSPSLPSRAQQTLLAGEEGVPVSAASLTFWKWGEKEGCSGGGFAVSLCVRISYQKRKMPQRHLVMWLSGAICVVWAT